MPYVLVAACVIALSVIGVRASRATRRAPPLAEARSLSVRNLPGWATDCDALTAEVKTTTDPYLFGRYMYDCYCHGRACWLDWKPSPGSRFGAERLDEELDELEALAN